MIEQARELPILGILRRSAMSAYALNRAVRAHAPLYRPLKQGNVYHLIAKLERAGLLLAKAAKSERGPNPTKSVFRLSASGERRFHALLQRIVTDVQAPDPAIEIGYVLLGQLTREKARALLAARLKEVNDQEKRLGRLFGDDERSAGGYLALSHTIARLRGEQEFLRESIALFNSKKWQAGWGL